MAQRRPESAAPEAGFQQLAEELAAMRQELASLRTTVAELVAALTATGAPAAAPQSPGAGLPPDDTPAVLPGAGRVPEPGPLKGEPRPMGSSPSALLARRNAERLAGEVQRRTALASDPGDDTELDLLIDRLHELALTKGSGPAG